MLTFIRCAPSKTNSNSTSAPLSRTGRPTRRMHHLKRLRRSHWRSSIIAGSVPLTKSKCCRSSPTRAQNPRRPESCGGTASRGGLSSASSALFRDQGLAKGVLHHGVPRLAGSLPAGAARSIHFFLTFSCRKKTTRRQINSCSDYRKQFPDDDIFPVKAKAMVGYRQESRTKGAGGL